MIYIDDHIQAYAEADIERWLTELPPWRRERAMAFRHDLGRRQSLLAYRLLCRALREEYDIDEPPAFTYAPHGKPELAFRRPEHADRATGRLHFSLSHCREAVACVIAPHPVGIDVESPRTVAEALVRHTMNAEECRAIAASPRPERAFLRLWTQKEAVLKLLGTGIRGDVKDILCSNEHRLETRETERWVMSVARYRKDDDGDPSGRHHIHTINLLR